MHVLVFKPSVSGCTGEMHDPVEVLGTLYESLKLAAGEEGPIVAIYSFNIVEWVKCPTCGISTHMQDNSLVRNPLYIAMCYYQILPSFTDCVGIHLLLLFTAVWQGSVSSACVAFACRIEMCAVSIFAAVLLLGILQCTS